MEQAPPPLAPPGAGVPLPQLLLMRFVLRPFVAERSPWEKSLATFEKVTRKIERELEGLTEAQLETRVLVPPQTGLEDSSRFWSIAMVLEHLVIVGRQISRGIRELDAGRLPPGEASTAAVKPGGGISAAKSLREFRAFCQEEMPALLPSLRRESPLRFRHPWFGQMNHRGWYWLLGTHHGLHLQQIRAIRRGLSAA